MRRRLSWRLRWAIYRARREVRGLVRRISPRARVFTFGAARIDPRFLALWIATPTDAERDQLRADTNLMSALRAAFIRAGYPVDAVPSVRIAVESEETIARDFGGKWSRATK